MADADERLRLDYAQTTELLRLLTDVRFKLLGFVPTAAGAAVVVLSSRPSTGELMAVGALGLMSTLGIVVYELRNTQTYDYAVVRAKQLEAALGFPSVADASRTGGLFTDRPVRDLRVLGVSVAGHDGGLGLVYGAALGGWAYLLSWGALHALGLGHAQQTGLVVGALAALLTLVGFLRAS